MLTVNVNDQAPFELDTKNNKLTLNGQPIKADWIKISATKFHAIIQSKSLTVELESVDEARKQFVIIINGVKYEVGLQNQYDILLKQLGLDKMTVGKVNHVKAPMPGMVLHIQVKEGDDVKKGDALLVLEAMKMENVIKAAGDAKIKKIIAKEKTAVEKGQTLIEFE
jgi:biotin carboxyl carrier protein